MKEGIRIAILACCVVVGCGDDVGSEVPRLTDDIEWVVRIQFSDSHTCTGIVLSEHWLLTAGHCVDDATDDQVEVSHEVFGRRTVVYEGAAHLVLHPDYKDIGHLAHRWHDVGLLGLRSGALEATTRGRVCGFTQSCAVLLSGDRNLYSVGYGRLPDPETGLCSDELGSKKRYDGLIFRELLGPLFANALGVELDGRRDALCDGDSGAPFMFDVDGVPHAFAVFSGKSRDGTIFSGTLSGPKVGWFESATAATEAPLDCIELGEGSWECFE